MSAQIIDISKRYRPTPEDYAKHTSAVPALMVDVDPKARRGYSTSLFDFCVGFSCGVIAACVIMAVR